MSTSPMEFEEPIEAVRQFELEEILKMASSTPLKKNDSWYLVDIKWYEQFERFVSDRKHYSNPGPVDNMNLFIQCKSWDLKNDLKQKVDYQIVPDKAWKLLLKCFGGYNENYSTQRWVIEEGKNQTICSVEIYCIELNLRLCDEGSEIMKNYYSRVTTLHDLKLDMEMLFHINSSQTSRIFHLDGELDTTDGKRLTDVGVFNNATIIMQVKNGNGMWPSDQRCTNIGSSTATKIRPAGLCGLTNMGNTCFMNSALQYLSNTPPLTEFITSEQYMEQINKCNPLGMNGLIAEAYGDLIKNMWSGKMNLFIPRYFKYVLGCFAPQFSGYAQEDSQELIAFLLDGLHEDFNRISERPPYEMKTNVDQRPDHIIAEESWKYHQTHNDSIIVDTFHGLLKSTLICTNCQLTDVSMDPFCYLSVPVPLQNMQINVMFVPATQFEGPKGNKKSNYNAATVTGLSVPIHGVIQNIVEALVHVNDGKKIVGHKLDSSLLIVTEVYDHHIHKIFEKNEAIADCNVKHIIIYEMTNSAYVLPVYLREIQTDGTVKLFGNPFFIGINEMHHQFMHQAAAEHLKNFVGIEFLQNNRHSWKDKSNCTSTYLCHENVANLFSMSLTNAMGILNFNQYNDSISFQSNRCLGLDVTTDNKRYYYNTAREHPLHIDVSDTQQEASISISECIDSYVKTETLEGANSWYCPKCKSSQTATKSINIWQLPSILIIHLKRFELTRYARRKIQTLVTFPVDAFKMNKHVANNPDKQPLLYDLIAVSNHCLTGGNIDSGHYTTYAKNFKTTKWFHYNDAEVNEVNEPKAVITKEAYVLFYCKRTCSGSEANTLSPVTADPAQFDTSL